MAQPTSYDVSDSELVSRAMKAAAEAGAANSGTCFDPAAGYRAATAQYLAGVLLARLARALPPYQPDDRVVVVGESAVGAASHKDPPVPPGTYAVSRVWYRDGAWFLELKGIRGGEEGSRFPLYPAKQFDPALGTVRVTSK